MSDRFSLRFDGAAAWAKLPADLQAAIGGLALELIIATVGEDVARQEEDDVRAHIFESAGAAAAQMLDAAVMDALVKSLELTVRPIPIPSIIGQVCRECGCTQDRACPGRCGWAEPDLCTDCAPHHPGELIDPTGSGPLPFLRRQPEGGR